MVIYLNEKIWFGKYKGKRLKEIIDNDISYVKKLLKENKSISLDNESINYINIKTKKIYYNIRYDDIIN
jgi:hypothetical protein